MAKAYNKQPLGRGLSALLNDPVDDIKSAEDKNADQIIGSVIELSIDQIKVNPFQPRTNFEDEKIIELASSIDQLGIIQPITVRKTGFKSFEIISGERRFRAVQSLKLQSIPADFVKSKKSFFEKNKPIKRLGNAANCKIIEVVAKKLKKYL